MLRLAVLEKSRLDIFNCTEVVTFSFFVILLLSFRNIGYRHRYGVSYKFLLLPCAFDTSARADRQEPRRCFGAPAVAGFSLIT